MFDSFATIDAVVVFPVPGDLLKERYPHLKLAVGEALQCPTILDNGFGGHRIEGIGDKHIPWIHNVKNTDMAIAIDDEDSQRLLRLFNTPEGQKYMKDELGMSDEEVRKMTWLGISGIANVLCCIKMAKYYELTENDVVATVLTDSAVMYQSRIEELNQMHGAYNAHEAALDHNLHMLGLKTDSMLELTYTVSQEAPTCPHMEDTFTMAPLWRRSISTAAARLLPFFRAAKGITFFLRCQALTGVFCRSLQVFTPNLHLFLP